MGNKFTAILLVNENDYDDQQSSSDKDFILPDETKVHACRRFFSKYRLLIIALILGALLATVIPLWFINIVQTNVVPEQYSCSLNPQNRIPCTNGGLNSTAGQCTSVGCCWDGKAVSVNGTTAPFCYHSYPSQFDYIVTGANFGENLTFEMTPWNANLKSFGEVSNKIQLTVDRVSRFYARIRATMVGAGKNPATLWPDIPDVKETDNSMLYGVVNSNPGDRFTLTIFRHSDNTALVTFDGGPMVLADNYTEFTVYAPSTNIYGLGEADHKNIKHSMNFEQYELLGHSRLDSNVGRHNYGVQPFYMCVEDSGNAHGVLFGVSQPAVVSLQPGRTISVKTSGQLIEVHVFVGPTPRDVMKQYTDVIGRPALPPYWGLGYHTCRSNGNTSIAYQVINDLYDSDIPHESDCGDSLMLRSLTIPSDNSSVYRQFANISSHLRDTDRKLVLFQGPFVYNGSSDQMPNPAFDDGVAAGIFIKNTSYSYYVGLANGRTVLYPDYRNSSTDTWLTDRYVALKQQADAHNITFDGIFLVDNTPLDQTDKSISQCQTNVSIPPISEYMMSYYFVDNDTVCLTALEPDDATPHSFWHNTYGKDHVKSVVSSIQSSSLITSSNDEGGRLMLASLSTFPGVGQYGGRWSGDFETSWAALNASLIQTLEFGLYGIPFTGNPICGFRGDLTDQDLCWKWMQMGALFPLVFTYYGPNEQPREPNFFDKSFQSMTRDVLTLRYLMLPYLYTLHYQASQTGEPIVRPLFYEFPTDNRTWNNGAQFMLGPSLLVSPSLTTKPGLTAYFPAGTWYEFQTRRPIVSKNGTNYDLLASQHFPNIYVKAGSIIPLQTPDVTTVNSQLNPFSVSIALDPKLQNSSCSASGQLYIDDGTPFASVLVDFGANFTAVWWNVTSTIDIDDFSNVEVSAISVTGVIAAPLNGTLCVIEPEYICELDGIFFDPAVNYLMVNISTLAYNFTTDFLMKWSY